MKSIPHNILIIKHGALGDLIQSFGLLMDIRNQYPESTINLLTAPAYYQLMHRCPLVDFVIVDSRAPIWRIDQQLKLKRKLQKQQIDLVIDLQNSDRSRMYQQFWLSTVKWIGRDAQEPPPASGLSGLIALLNKAGIDTPHAYQPDMAWMADDVTDLLKEKGITQQYVVLIPGSSKKHLEKRWPYYPALANALMNVGKQVVVCLGPDEASLAKTIPGTILQNLDWFALAGVLKGASYIIGNDTGPSHIASYLNKPGLAIFGPMTSASRAEIGRRNFETIEVNQLASLTVERVLQHLTRWEHNIKAA